MKGFMVGQAIAMAFAVLLASATIVHQLSVERRYLVSAPVGTTVVGCLSQGVVGTVFEPPWFFLVPPGAP